LFFATASTISTLVIHTILNIALIRRSTAEARKTLKFISTRYIFPVISTIFVIIAIYYAVSTLTMPLLLSPVLVLVYSILAVVLVYAYRRKISIPGFKDPGSEIQD
jgi:hypothetical protein